MKFEEALAAMREGKSVRRAIDFIGSKTYLTRLENYCALIQKCQGFYEPYTRTLHGHDLMAEDWEVVDG